jgi:regulator of replication initiation timing
MNTDEIKTILNQIDALADRAVELRKAHDRLLAEVRMLEVENARLRARLSHYETNEIERRLADGTG